VLKYASKFVIGITDHLRPFVRYYLGSLLMNVVFNVSSDFMSSLMPLPLFSKVVCHGRRKLLLVLPFTMGIFTIFASIICKVETLLILSNEW